jgi:hypothetical protein
VDMLDAYSIDDWIHASTFPDMDFRCLRFDQYGGGSGSGIGLPKSVDKMNSMVIHGTAIAYT